MISKVMYILPLKMSMLSLYSGRNKITSGNHYTKHEKPLPFFTNILNHK